MSFDDDELTRRGMIAAAALVSAGVLTWSRGVLVPAEAAEQARKGKQGTKAGEGKGNEGDEDVSATEDLMREHGVLRRTLIVYAEAARALRTRPDSIAPAALADAAALFRSFGEDYHERILEEEHVFPEVHQAGGPNEKLVDVLLIQHQRGREITDYITSVTRGGRIGSGHAEPLSNVLEAMVRMYEAHATWEDTVIFPAWKKEQSKARLDELAEKFEEIEHQQFGKDGFEDALKRIARVEEMLGLSDLDRYTAPEPPNRG